MSGTRSPSAILAERLEVTLALGNANAAQQRAQARAGGAEITVMADRSGSRIAAPARALSEARAGLAAAEARVETLEARLAALDAELAAAEP
jgi:hypothetical protein